MRFFVILFVLSLCLSTLYGHHHVTYFPIDCSQQESIPGLEGLLDAHTTYYRVPYLDHPVSFPSQPIIESISEDPCWLDSTQIPNIISSNDQYPKKYSDSCDSCIARHPSCGWCQTTSSCHFGTSNGPFISHCPNNWIQPSSNSCPMVYKKHPMTIAAFIRSWTWHGSGGMERHAEYLYKSLASLGHDVHVFTTPSKNYNPSLPVLTQLKYLKTKKYTFPSRGQLSIYPLAGTIPEQYTSEYFSKALLAFQHLHSTLDTSGFNHVGFDVVHSESIAAAPLLNYLPVPTIMTHHGTFSDWFRNQLNSVIMEFTSHSIFPQTSTLEHGKFYATSSIKELTWLNSVSQHIVISEQAELDLVHISHVPRSRIQLIHNGVDVNDFQIDRVKRFEFRNQHSIFNNSTIIIGISGKLIDIKGHAWLVRIVPKILDRYPQVIIWIAGVGDYKQQYTEIQNKYPNNRLNLLGGLKYSKMPYFFNAIDILLDGSIQHHGFNTVLIEAISCGKAILAQDVGSVTQTLGPAATLGGIFQLGNQVDFFKQLDHLLSIGVSGLGKLGMENRKRFDGLFSLDRMARSYEQLFFKTIDSGVVNNIPSHTLFDSKVSCDSTNIPYLCWLAVNPAV